MQHDSIHTRQTLHEGGFAEFGRYSCISQIGATGTFDTCRMDGAVRCGGSSGMYRRPSKADFQRVLKGGDRAGLSMDAQKSTKTEWEYGDMCGGKKDRQL